jgi:hypothetical protein
MSGTTYNQWGVPNFVAPQPQAPATNTGGMAPFWGNPLFGGNWYQQQQAPGALSPTATSLLGRGIQPAFGDMAALFQQLPPQQQAAALQQPSGGAVGASGYNRWGQQAAPQGGAQTNPQRQQQLAQYMQASPQDWNSPAGMMASGINSQMDALSRAFGMPFAAWSPGDVHGLLGSALGGGGGGSDQNPDAAGQAAAAAEHSADKAAAGQGGSNIYG